MHAIINSTLFGLLLEKYVRQSMPTCFAPDRLKLHNPDPDF